MHSKSAVSKLKHGDDASGFVVYLVNFQTTVLALERLTAKVARGDMVLQATFWGHFLNRF